MREQIKIAENIITRLEIQKEVALGEGQTVSIGMLAQSDPLLERKSPGNKRGRVILKYEN